MVEAADSVDGYLLEVADWCDDGDTGTALVDGTADDAWRFTSSPIST